MEIPKEINIVSAEEAEKCDAVACVRIQDMPIPRNPSAMELCSECKSRIWVSETSPKMPKRFCIQCITEIARRSDDGNQT